jgi:hypothetical protein
MHFIPLQVDVPDAIPAANLDLGNFERELRAAREAAGSAASLVAASASTMVRRFDAMGVAPAATLTDRIREILVAPWQPAEGLDQMIIPQRAWTQPGYEQTEIMRVERSGEVRNARGGAGIPMVGESTDTETFDVGFYVCGFKVDMWERMSRVNTILNIASFRAETARIVQGQAASARTFNGDTLSGLPGLFNHPYIPVSYNTVNYVSTSTSTDDILADIGALRRKIGISSYGTARATKCVIASKIAAAFDARPRSSTSDTTLLAWLRSNWRGGEGNNVSTVIVESETLNDAGPDGEHGILFYDDRDPNALFNDVPVLPTFLAPQTVGFEDRVYVWMSHAGVKTFHPYKTHLVWTKVS